LISLLIAYLIVKIRKQKIWAFGYQL
jgi:hypothetical protein